MAKHSSDQRLWSQATFRPVKFDWNQPPEPVAREPEESAEEEPKKVAAEPDEKGRGSAPAVVGSRFNEDLLEQMTDDALRHLIMAFVGKLRGLLQATKNQEQQILSV